MSGFQQRRWSVCPWVLFVIVVPMLCATFSDDPEDWDNLDGTNGGYNSTYTFNGQPVHDYESSSDPSNGGTGVQPSSVDLSSASPDGFYPGVGETPQFGYYNGGTEYDSNDPSTLNDDFIRFTLRLDDDPSHSSALTSAHWNILVDVDDDGYKDFWIDVDGSHSSNGSYDRVQVLFDDENDQEVGEDETGNDPVSDYRVDVFRAADLHASDDKTHTRVRAVGDGSGDYYLDVQVPMVAMTDTNGNQKMYPNTPIGFVFSTSASNTNPLQKDFMADLDFLSAADPITFGDVIKPNGEPIIYFTDSELNEVSFYEFGVDDIYVFVRHPFANTDDATTQQITVTVSDPVTGDDELLTLTETQPNTGVFTNRGGTGFPTATDGTREWIPFVKPSIIATSETWTATYNSTDSDWDITGSMSGGQGGTATAANEYTTDNNDVAFTIYENSPQSGDTITFSVTAGDALDTVSTDSGDNSDHLQTTPGNTITVTYSHNGDSFTDDALITGTGAPVVLFTLVNGNSVDEYELNATQVDSDEIYITVYHDASNTNAGTAQSITVNLSGNDTENSITLTETGVNTGIFRNTTAVDSQATTSRSSNNNVWEDVDGATVTATFTYNSTDYTDTATLSVAGAGVVRFTNGGRTADVDKFSADQAVFIEVDDASGPTGSEFTVDVTSPSPSSDTEAVKVYETASGSGVYSNVRYDLGYSLGGNTVTASSATFQTDTAVDNKFVIATGPDAGTYLVSSITDQNNLVLKNLDGSTVSFSETRTGMGFVDEPLFAGTYDNAAVDDDGTIEAQNTNTLTVSYDDLDDGDSDGGNNIKTDTGVYNAPPIVINEVLFYPETVQIDGDNDPMTPDNDFLQPEYVELYNASPTDTINITGYRIYDGELFDYTIPQRSGADIMLGPGESFYIVSVAGQGVPAVDLDDSGATDIYYGWFDNRDGGGDGQLDLLEDPNATDKQDQLTLFDNSGTPVVVDYVGWSSTATTSADFKSDDADAVNAGIWSDNVYRDVGSTAPEGLITTGEVIKRATDGKDTDLPADWVYGTPSLDIDFLITLASIVRFEANVEDGNVVVEWETASEIGTLGFKLFRQEPDSGRYVPVSGGFVRSGGNSPTGNTYRVIDTAVEAGERATYRLLEFETSVGRSTHRRHGPYQVVVGGDGVDYTWRNENDVRTTTRRVRRRLAPKALPRVGGMRGTDSPSTLCVTVASTGMQYVGVDTIASAFGLTTGAIRQALASGNLSLCMGDTDVHYLRAAGNGGFYFYAEVEENLYRKTYDYRLALTPGQHMAYVPAPALQTPEVGSHVRTYTFEDNMWAQPQIFSNESADYWFGRDYLFAGVDGFGSREIPFQLATITGQGEASLQLIVQATSDSLANLDHRLQVALNGTFLTEHEWDGTREQVITATFSGDVLNDGENSLELVATVTEPTALSIIFVQSFSVTCDAWYTATDGYLTFAHSDDVSTVTIDGFDSPQITVLDVRDPAAPIVLAGARRQLMDDGSYGVAFTGAGHGTEYHVFDSTAVHIPSIRAMADTAYLRAADTRADYVLIAPAEMVDGAQVLANYRAAEGFESMVVSWQDIRDEFADGANSPYAIRDFLIAAHASWAVPPQYLVIVGSGTYDYRDLQAHGDNVIPTAMVPSPDGLFPSDVPLGDIDGDNVPDVAVGRLPVLNTEELAGVIAKIQAFESTLGGGWSSRLLLVADNGDAAGNFGGDNAKLMEIVGDEYSAEQIALGEDASIESVRSTVHSELRNGVLLLNYFGHGGMDRLATEGILVTDDVPNLGNIESQPIVCVMACLAANFGLPGFTTLGEALVLQVGGGATAVWGPSGLSAHRDARLLNDAFVEAAFGQFNRLGPAIVEAARRYRLHEEARFTYVPSQYNLLGDPAQRLR